MKYFYILSLLLLTFAYCSKKSEVSQQVASDDDSLVNYISSGTGDAKNNEEEEVKVPFSPDRKLRFLYVANGGVRGFYDDGTLVGCPRCDPSKENLEAMQASEPMGTYIIDEQGKLWTGSGTDTPNMEDDPWTRDNWWMIDYQWRQVPEGIDAEVPEVDFGLADVGVEMLLFRSILEDDEDVSPKSDWYQLSYIGGDRKFQKEKINLSRESFYWDCGEMDVPFVKSDSELEGLILFRGLELSETNTVKSHFHKINCVTPEKKYTFTFEGQEYTLRAEGFLVEPYYHSDEPGEDGRKDTSNGYINYKLYLSSGNEEQLLMSIPSFEDNFIAIEFIGDLDDDGKPDFIFESSRHYEYNESTLYLSSFAKDGDLVKCVAQNGYGLFC